jgi:hypothetical protein
MVAGIGALVFALGALFLLPASMGRDWVRGSDAPKETIAINGIRIRAKGGGFTVYRPAPKFVRRFASPVFRVSLVVIGSGLVLTLVGLPVSAWAGLLPILLIVAAYLLIVFRRRKSSG